MRSNRQQDFYGNMLLSIATPLRAGRNVDGAIKELTDHGHDEKDVAARVKSITGDLYAKGEISRSQAQRLLKKYGRKTSGGMLAASSISRVR